MDYSKVTVITGHYGSGKTNISVNMALELAARGEKVTVVDLDIVNPYFRTADFEELFAQHNIKLVVPMYANSNLDIPALSFDIRSIADSDGYIIIDVGGDDEGAKALGRYLPVFSSHDTKMLYVVNCYRYLTKEPEEALELMKDIERASGLKCSGIINNSNLGNETDGDTVRKSLSYAEEIAKAAGLPLLANCSAEENLKNVEKTYPVKVFVKKLWEEDI